MELEKSYRQLVLSSGLLLKSVEKNADSLEQSMDKRVGTEVNGKDNGKENGKDNGKDNGKEEGNSRPVKGSTSQCKSGSCLRELEGDMPTRDKPKGTMEGDQELEEGDITNNET